MDVKFEKFLIEASLYDELAITYDDFDDIVDFLKCQVKIDIYCNQCQEKRVFIGKSNKIYVPKKENFVPIFHDNEPELDACILKSFHDDELKRFAKFIASNAITVLNYCCSKDESHILTFVVFLTEKSIIKIGQYPSYADIEKPQIKRFKNILKNYYSEINTAIALYSCHIGIGSFVYLRRIVEKLVYDAFKQAEQLGCITEKEFEYQADGKHRNGMEEKIRLLRGFLPDLMTDNPKVYGIVSKGVHELSEQECLKYFPVIKDGIVIILDDLLSKIEKSEAEAEYKKSLGQISEKYQ